MFGVGVWDDCGASRSFQCMKGVWHSEFRDRMETDLFLNGKGKLEGAPVVTRALEGFEPRSYMIYFMISHFHSVYYIHNRLKEEKGGSRGTN